ncbi:MAG: hypothetical protein ABIH83_05715, partial [Candidatus Micrarchaeota archaeon]
MAKLFGLFNTKKNSTNDKPTFFQKMARKFSIRKDLIFKRKAIMRDLGIDIRTLDAWGVEFIKSAFSHEQNGEFGLAALGYAQISLRCSEDELKLKFFIKSAENYEKANNPEKAAELYADLPRYTDDLGQKLIWTVKSAETYEKAAEM